MKPFKIKTGIEIVDAALYLAEEKVLAISDLHIGQEEALIKQGVLIPKHHFKDLVMRVEKIFSVLAKTGRKVEVVVINGDLKHEFGTISDEEWRNTLKMLDYLARKCKRIVLVRGNHDSILGPITEKRKVMFVNSFIVGDVLFVHGDNMTDVPSGIKTIVIGHDHPAVLLDEGLRSEKYKCFLVGKWKRKDLIVLPSLNPLSEGTDVLTEKPLGQFLKKDLSEFDVYVVADKIYEFGKVKKLKRL